MILERYYVPGILFKKALGMDRIIDSIVERLGNLETAYLVGDYAEGKDTGIIDLVLVGDIDKTNLADLVTKTEEYIGRKIRTLVVGAESRLTIRFLRYKMSEYEKLMVEISELGQEVKEQGD